MGYRLGPDGNPFTIIFTVDNGSELRQANWVQVAELLIGYWDAVGVRCSCSTRYQMMCSTRPKTTNEIEATIYTGEGGAGLTAILDPRYLCAR